ncbi:MAG: hypothetical protein V1837_06730 [Candidatus Woesearchaeota archaeon]
MKKDMLLDLKKELAIISIRLEKLEDKVDYIDRNVKKYGDDFCISTPIKDAKGRITWKEKRLSEKEKRKLVGL